MKQVMPFFYYSKSFPKILHKIKSTLIYSTYQAGKVIMISSLNGESIVKYAKNFKRPMGIAVSEDSSTLAIASKSEIGIFSANPVLAASYPEQPKKYSHLYIPQSKFNTGIVDTHEIAWADKELLITNTAFSCISKMSHRHHFEEYWKPSFIQDLAPEDRCHLNGVAFVDKKPKYVTMFAESNEPKGWRSLPYNSGILMDVDTGEILLRGLALPHSPVFHNGNVYFLLSGTGDVMCYNVEKKEANRLSHFNAFVRGMEVIGDLIFLGMSKIRKDSQFFSQLPITPEESFCGIRVIDRLTGKELGGLTYTERIEEIFAVKIAKGVVSPAILTERDELYDKCISLPNGQSYWLEEDDNTIN
ncbi:MAG: hypothetical protein ACI9A7_000301 [Cyclobacteriaceae bacterium]|jgi:uncharacterized protein (TIGR03032 family)